MPVHRVPRLVIGCASAALLVSSFPAAALADPSPAPSGSVTSSPSSSPAPSAEPLTVRWDDETAGGPRTASARRGSAVALPGRVTSADGTSTAGLTVALDRADFDGRTVPANPRWAEVGHAVTDDDGSIRFDVAPTRSSLFRARVVAAGERPEASSAAYPVAVQDTVRIAVANPLIRTVPNGSHATVTGVVTDSTGTPVAGLPLSVERHLKGQSWTPYVAMSTTSTGAFAFTARSASAQLIEYRVRSEDSPAYTAALSGLVLQESRYDPFDKAQLDRMVRSVRASGLKVGVGLVDRKTGQKFNFGYGQSTFYTASVAKVMVAMDVLRDSQGRSAPPAATASKLRSMIRNSNDAITWSYWRSRGGAKVVQRINARCGTTVRVDNNTWSMSRPTPVQMAMVLDCLADGRAISPTLSSFLMYQMRNVTSSQRWGIPAANPDQLRAEMNKNGWWRWPCCNFWTVNSTGLFGPGNRYAFTVFTQYGGALPQSRGERQAYNVTRAMYPWGTIIY
jgi:protocatechuate 3,4-dioxygenase beta subunit